MLRRYHILGPLAPLVPSLTVPFQGKILIQVDLPYRGWTIPNFRPTQTRHCGITLPRQERASSRIVACITKNENF